MSDLNPQREQMADESMVRTLDAQARAIWLDYVIVDTLRVPRETFAGILTAWRDGYVDPISEKTGWDRETVAAYFNQMIGDIRDPRRYGVWMVPVVSARKPR